VTIYDGETDYDFTFLPSGLISFSSEDAGAHKVRRKKMPPRDAIAILKSLSSSPVIQCTSTDYSRQFIGTESVADSKVLDFVLPMTVPVLPSFLKNALWKVESRPACV
jgi:hypothetical protein